jgi:hypothetical protein
MRTDAGRVDPYEALGEALRAIVEDAVAGALAALKPAAGAEPVMVSVPEAAERLGVGTGVTWMSLWEDR